MDLLKIAGIIVLAAFLWPIASAIGSFVLFGTITVMAELFGPQRK